MPAPITITPGDRYGRLTLQGIYPVKHRCGQRRVVALCDCGNRSIHFLCDVRSGRATSCGCGKRASLEEHRGQRFGRLVVVDPYHSLSRVPRGSKASRVAIALCRCDCGSETTVRIADLVAGARHRGRGTQSCGCLQAEVQRARLKALRGASVEMVA